MISRRIITFCAHLVDWHTAISSLDHILRTTITARLGHCIYLEYLGSHDWDGSTESRDVAEAKVGTNIT